MGSIDADLEVEVVPGRLPGGSSLLVEAPLGGALDSSPRDLQAQEGS